MKFTSSKFKVAVSVAFLVSLIHGFLAVHFQAFIDATIGLPLPPPPPSPILTCGVLKVFSTEAKGFMKMDLEGDYKLEQIATADAVPRANFAISTVEPVADNIYKVTGNFETVDADTVNSQLSPILERIVLENTGYGPDILNITTKFDVKLDNIARFSVSFYVQVATYPNNVCCLPDDLQLKFYWTPNSKPDLFEIFTSLYSDVSVYSFESASDKLNDLEEIDPNSYQRRNEDLEKKNLKVSIELSASLQKWRSNQNVLPNFCWPCKCPSTSTTSPSSQILQSSTTAFTSSASLTPSTTLPASSTSSLSFTGITSTLDSPSATRSPAETSEVYTSENHSGSFLISTSTSSDNDEAKVVTLQKTLVVTVTSCADNRCTKLSGLTVTTEEIASYTTFRPISSINSSNMDTTNELPSINLESTLSQKEFTPISLVSESTSTFTYTKSIQVSPTAGTKPLIHTNSTNTTILTVNAVTGGSAIGRSAPFAAMVIGLGVFFL